MIINLLVKEHEFLLLQKRVYMHQRIVWHIVINEATVQNKIDIENLKTNASTRRSLRINVRCDAPRSVRFCSLFRFGYQYLGSVLIARRVGTSLSRDQRSCWIAVHVVVHQCKKQFLFVAVAALYDCRKIRFVFVGRKTKSGAQRIHRDVSVSSVRFLKDRLWVVCVCDFEKLCDRVCYLHFTREL